MDSTFGNTSPGSASASKTAQLLSGGPAITSTVNDGGVSNALGTYSGTVMPVSGVGTFLITATPEIGSLAMIGSGLVFLSMVASSNRKRRKG
jgi:hypothetical protein